MSQIFHKLSRLKGHPQKINFTIMPTVIGLHTRRPIVNKIKEINGFGWLDVTTPKLKIVSLQ